MILHNWSILDADWNLQAEKRRGTWDLFSEACQSAKLNIFLIFHWITLKIWVFGFHIFDECWSWALIFGSIFSGSVQCNIWDSLVPSRKRTCMGRPKSSSVEKLTRDLHSILHQQASYISGSPEDELLYETETPWGSVEIGNGGVLIRHPNAAILEDESEASSLPIDNKSSTASEAYSGVSSLPVNSVGKDLVDENVKRTPAAEEHASRYFPARLYCRLPFCPCWGFLWGAATEGTYLIWLIHHISFPWA